MTIRFRLSAKSVSEKYVPSILFALCLLGNFLAIAEERSNVLLVDKNDYQVKRSDEKDFTCIDGDGKESIFTAKTVTKVEKGKNDISSAGRTWIAFIKTKNVMGGRIDGSVRSQTCGGVLITKRLVLTAAHCCCDQVHCKARI